jgi:azurin
MPFLKPAKLGAFFAVWSCGVLFSEMAFAKVCDFSVKATDDIVFDVTIIKVQKDCKKIKVHFKHGGTVLKHNWVLVKKSELDRIRKDGEAAGEAANFLPKGNSGVIAQTKLIEPGIDATAEIDMAQIKKGTEYAYFCSFPGHGATMRGVLSFAN